jgi:hypothetical protein
MSHRWPIATNQPTLPWLMLRPTAAQRLNFVYVKDLADLGVQALLSDIQHRSCTVTNGGSYYRYELPDFFLLTDIKIF